MAPPLPFSPPLLRHLDTPLIMRTNRRTNRHLLRGSAFALAGYCLSVLFITCYVFTCFAVHGATVSLSLSVYLSTLSSLPPSSLPCVFSFHLLPIIPWPPLFPVRLFRDLIIPRTPFFLPVIGLVCVASSVIPRQSHPLMQSSLLAPLCLSFVCICLPLICLLVCLLPRITSCPIFMVIIYFFIICLFLSAVPNFSLPSSTSLVH